MFIACVPYKIGVGFSRNNESSDKVLVFDTEDVSLEYISKSVLIENIEIDEHGTSFIGSSMLNNYDLDLYKCDLRCDALSFYVGMDYPNNCGQVVFSISNDFYMYNIKGYKIGYNNSLYKDEFGGRIKGTSLIAGDRKYFLEAYKGMEISYAFLYRDLLVLRCSFEINEYATVKNQKEEYAVNIAINKNNVIVAIWDATGACLMGDKSLGIKIDTLHNY